MAEQGKKLRITVEIEAESNLREGTEDLDDFTEGLEAVRVSAGQAAEELEKIREENERTADEARQLAINFEDTADSVQNLHDELRDGPSLWDDQMGALQQAESNLEDYTEEVREAETALERYWREHKELNQVLEQVADEERRREAATREAAEATDKATSKVRVFGIELDKMKLRQTAVIGGVAGLVGGLTSKVVDLAAEGFERLKDAVIDFARAADEGFASAEERAARMRAQVGDLTTSTRTLVIEAANIGKEIGFLPDDVLDAQRKALNLGLEYSEAMDAVAASAVAARVGNVDLVDTLVAGTTASVAYMGQMGTTSEILDYFAYITQNSNLELDDLVTGMAEIISPAAEAGVSIRDVSAAMIAMSRQGDDFAEISSLLGNFLVQISVTGTEANEAFETAAGVGFRQFIDEGGNLVEVLEILQVAADEANVSVQDLIGGGSKFYIDRQAGRGAQELANQAEIYAQSYAEMDDVTGSLNESAEEFDDTMYNVNRRLDASRAAAHALGGGAFGPLSRTLKELKIDWFDMISVQGQGAEFNRFFTESFVEMAEEMGRTESVFTNTVTGLSEVSDSAFQASSEAKSIFSELKESVRDAEGEVDFVELNRRLELFLAILKDAAEAGRDLDVENLIQAVITPIDESLELIDSWNKEMIQAKEDARVVVDQLAQVETMLKRMRVASRAETRPLEEWQELAKELNASFEDAYVSSVAYIDQLSGLEVELGLAETKEEVASAQEAIDQFLIDTEKNWYETFIRMRLASEGYSISLIDLSENLGLITSDQAAQQHEFLLIETQIEALSRAFDKGAYSADAQAEGLIAVTEGGKTAQEAIAGVQTNIDQALATDLVGGYADIGVQYDPSGLDPANQARKEYEDTVWQSTAELDWGPAKDDVDDMVDYLDLYLADRELVVNVVYNDPGFDPGGGGGGGSAFDIPCPAGTVRQPDGSCAPEVLSSTPIPGRAPGDVSGMESVQQGGIVMNFYTTVMGDGNPQRIANAQRDTLYQALERVGLT